MTKKGLIIRRPVERQHPGSRTTTEAEAELTRQYRTSPTKSGSDLRSMVDVHAPPIRLLAKLGSIIVHVDEAHSSGGHEFDWAAIGSLLADREVQDWLAGMQKLSLLPLQRKRP